MPEHDDARPEQPLATLHPIGAVWLWRRAGTVLQRERDVRLERISQPETRAQPVVPLHHSHVPACRAHPYWVQSPAPANDGEGYGEVDRLDSVLPGVHQLRHFWFCHGWK